MSRFTPATPRSRRLGRELRKLRDAKGLRLEDAAKLVNCSTSRLSRIESGDIKPRPGDVMELLVGYGHPIDAEPGTSLLVLARDLKESGWWQRLGALSNRYATFIAYEEEAVELRNFEPTLIPGLLQTEEYAREVNAVGRETDAEAIRQLVRVRLTRQQVLRRKPKPLRVHTIISEAALSVDVGGPEVMRDQLIHLVELAKLPNITVQVLRFAAGAHMATSGGLQILVFDKDEPALGYLETLAGELFLEAPRDISRLNQVYDHLRTLAVSPAESVKLIKERASDAQERMDHVDPQR
ncbi:helix-turn-helix transcriptional regulator [Micromonospora sp. WMMD1082]|uniref:helix-turn-helix domain-containing protein n=1 Tax=Micromonospora sp. WMMD1082 TaxID=3016104 RepID=UPI002417F061|nr:helix-turn-helix transcriptional regulator [Micromonospora sp. WMMD1082]MDG4798719.1 helix-turn-helix transcriptional regulator [Micromonospora sp. WMMD1082]